MARIRKSDRIEWPTPKKARFRALVELANWSTRRAASEVGVPQSTAVKWLRTVGDRRTGRLRPGRPCKITPEVLEAIDKWFPGYYDHRRLNLAEIIKEFKLDCSIWTLYRALLKVGYHLHIPEVKEYLSPKNKKERLDFALKHEKKSKYWWRRGIYTDESSFNSRMMRRLKIWRKRGERFRLDCIQFRFHSGRESFMAWGAIGWNFKSELILLTSESNAKGFSQKAYERQVLRTELARIAAIKKMGTGKSDFFCVEDNSRVHGKKTTPRNHGLCNRARVECNIHSIEWPPKSPDLNPIENVWRFIKQRLRNRKPHGGWSLCDLREAVVDIWDNELTPEVYNKWINELPIRIQAVIARKGGVTKY
jgi:transposase